MKEEEQSQKSTQQQYFDTFQAPQESILNNFLSDLHNAINQSQPIHPQDQSSSPIPETTQSQLSPKAQSESNGYLQEALKNVNMDEKDTAIEQLRDQIIKKAVEILNKEYKVFKIRPDHIQMVCESYGFQWTEKLSKSVDFQNEYTYVIKKAESVMQNFEQFGKQIREILKSPIECDNKIISCNFTGTYHQYLDHIYSECKYEFCQQTNILRICKEQKKFQPMQVQYYQQCLMLPEDDCLDKVPTLLVANFPQVGMVELFKKFGEIDKFHFDNKNNLIFYVTYKERYSQKMAMEQLSQVEIQGKRLRVTEFIDKETLKKCRLFVKGLQSNDELYIKNQLEYLVQMPITQVSLMNQKNAQHDASAFIQFQAQDMNKAQLLIDKIFPDTAIGKRIQIKSYRPREENHYHHHHHYSGNNFKNNNNKKHM